MAILKSVNIFGNFNRIIKIIFGRFKISQRSKLDDLLLLLLLLCLCCYQLIQPSSEFEHLIWVNGSSPHAPYTQKYFLFFIFWVGFWIFWWSLKRFEKNLARYVSGLFSQFFFVFYYTLKSYWMWPLPGQFSHFFVYCFTNLVIFDLSQNNLLCEPIKNDRQTWIFIAKNAYYPSRTLHNHQSTANWPVVVAQLVASDTREISGSSPVIVNFIYC